MTIFRKKIGTDVWHWSKGCPDWIGNGYTEEKLPKGFRPREGDLCPTCLAKEKAAVKNPTKRKEVS